MRTESTKVHIISHLGKEHPQVVEEMKKTNSKIEFHALIEPKDEDNFSFARSLTNQILELPIKVGSIVVFVMGDSDILIENLCVSTTQRRFNETVTVYVVRSSHKEEIPYLMTLRADKGGMVDYNYPGACGSCSGNCSSC